MRQGHFSDLEKPVLCPRGQGAGAEFQEDSGLKAAWEAAGVKWGKLGTAPTVDVRITLPGGEVVTRPEQVTLEHGTRRVENPFRAVDPRNLMFSFRHENVADLERFRRVDRLRGALFTDDPIEKLMLEERARRGLRN
jgi:hypothetical protein